MSICIKKHSIFIFFLHDLEKSSAKQLPVSVYLWLHTILVSSKVAILTSPSSFILFTIANSPTPGIPTEADGID